MADVLTCFPSHSKVCLFINSADTSKLLDDCTKKKFNMEKFKIMGFLPHELAETMLGPYSHFQVSTILPLF